MSNKKYQKLNVDELVDEIVITGKLGWGVGPKLLQEACKKIAEMDRSAISHRATRLGKKRLQK